MSKPRLCATTPISLVARPMSGYVRRPHGERHSFQLTALGSITGDPLLAKPPCMSALKTSPPLFLLPRLRMCVHTCMGLWSAVRTDMGAVW